AAVAAGIQVLHTAVNNSGLVILSASKLKKLCIIDLSDFTYCSIFLCVLCLSMFPKQKEKMEKRLEILFAVLIFFNVLFLCIYYYDDNGIITDRLSIIFTCIISILTFLYRFFKYEKGQKDEC
ncbi:MAG: hypothetical protein LUE16_00545, partial [Lachnospiraceae bacterium]|nr:hypothetical protein [Lachnospiraceae bacterium]